MNYPIKCEACSKVIGQSSIENAKGLICGACSLIPKVLPEAKPTLEDRISALETDIVKVTDVMVSKGDLVSKDISVKIEPIGLEEELIP